MKLSLARPLPGAGAAPGTPVPVTSALDPRTHGQETAGAAIPLTVPRARAWVAAALAGLVTGAGPFVLGSPVWAPAGGQGAGREMAFWWLAVMTQVFPAPSMAIR